MVLKLLGLADLIVAAGILLIHYDNLNSWRIGLLFAGYLFLKGLAFRSSLQSYLDMMTGCFVIVLLFDVKTSLTFILTFYLFQKSVFSIAG